MKYGRRLVAEMEHSRSSRARKAKQLSVLEGVALLYEKVLERAVAHPLCHKRPAGHRRDQLTEAKEAQHIGVAVDT